MPGQYYDDETGLHYNWHRYYHARIGKYLTKDPVGLRAGINLYIYAKTNPLKLSDHNGLKGCGPGKVGKVGIFNNPNGYPFGACCDAHDECYSGKTGCKSKKECDDEFHNCMKDVCAGLDIPEAPLKPDPETVTQQEANKSDCRRVASDYHSLVECCAKGSFCSEERKLKCGLDPLCSPREQPDCEENYF